MKAHVFALALALLGAGSALAADLPTTKSPPPPPPPPVFDWTGLYIGATAGYAWGHSEHCDTPAFCTAGFGVDGFTGGGTIGFNYQFKNWPLIVGFEADISDANARGTTLTVPGVFGCGATSCYTVLDWFSTARARVGTSFMNNWFPYVTGGFAYGGLRAGLGGAPPFGTSNSGPEGGWTVGGGVEYALPFKNWSVKVEYLYVQVGNLFYNTAHVCGDASCTAVQNNYNVARLGVNYHF